jgi:glycosyltransferase involved in cell wall biosynthesis
MKILFMTPGYVPAYRMGGITYSVSAAAESLVKAGHSVTVFTTNGNLDQDLDVEVNVPTIINGVEVWYFKRTEPQKKYFPFLPYLSRTSGFWYAPDMKAELRRIMPSIDVVHTQLPFGYPTLIGGNAARRAKKPLFYNQRGDFDPERLKYRGIKKRLFLQLFEMPNLRYATALIALTEAEKSSYRALGLTNRIEVIPNGIDPAKYTAASGDDSAIDDVVPHQSTVILFMGRLHSVKGADRLVDAFIGIAAANPHAVLVMAGPDEHGLQSSFREKLESSGLRDRVVFPGMVTGDIKTSWLQRADLFCLPSDAEGFSVAILEALAAKTAVLISPGCHFEEVETAGAGIVCEATVPALEVELSNLLSDPDRLKEMAAKGYDLVMDKYTWSVITEQLIAAYSKGPA